MQRGGGHKPSAKWRRLLPLALAAALRLPREREAASPPSRGRWPRLVVVGVLLLPRSRGLLASRTRFRHQGERQEMVEWVLLLVLPVLGSGQLLLLIALNIQPKKKMNEGRLAVAVGTLSNLSISYRQSR